jgi:hypothetical protein
MDGHMSLDAWSQKKTYIVINILKIIAILLVVALVWFSQRAWHGYEQYRNQDAVQHSIIKMNGTIIHLDEVLTMSAKMATATGDLRWEDRYRSFEPILNAAIKKGNRSRVF